MVCFDTKIIVYNAFLSSPEINGHEHNFLTFNDLRKFCSNLYDAIFRAGYKYISINCSKENMDVFCEKDGNFIRGIDKVYCIHGIDSAYVEELNKKYPEDIQAILNMRNKLW